MLGRIAVPSVALMVAVDRVPAGAVECCARGHRHATSGRQPGADTAAGALRPEGRDYVPLGGIRHRPTVGRSAAGDLQTRAIIALSAIANRNSVPHRRIRR
jgi:hypothetical protein